MLIALSVGSSPSDPLAPCNLYETRRRVIHVSGFTSFYDIRHSYQPAASSWGFRVPLMPEGFFEVQSEISRKVRERSETLTDAERERVTALIAERCRTYAKDGDIRFPATAMIVTGTA